MRACVEAAVGGHVSALPLKAVRAQRQHGPIRPDSRQSSVDATFAVFDIFFHASFFHGPRFVSKRGGTIVPFF